MPVTNISSPDFEFLAPGTYQDYSKIVIIDDSGTTNVVLNTYDGDITENLVTSATITREATGKLSSFRITLSNSDGSLLNKFDGGETVIFYSDSTTAETEIFRATVDEVFYSYSSSIGFTVEITGRQYPELMDKTVTGVFAAATGDEAICNILYNDYDDIELTYWTTDGWATASYDSDNGTVTWSTVSGDGVYDSSTYDNATYSGDINATIDFPDTLLNFTYEHRKGWNVLVDICKKIDLDCYLEYSDGWKLRTFKEGGIVNTNCAVAYGINLLRVSEYGVPNLDVYNGVWVYGNNRGDNVILFKTKNDSSSQSNLWIKDKIINEPNINTMDELNEEASFQLSTGVNVNPNGRITAIGMKSLNPGEVINVSVPYCGINGQYTVKRFTHTFKGYIETSFEISKTFDEMSDLFIPQVNYDGFLSGFNNPNEMIGSLTKFFDAETDGISLTNCYYDSADDTIKLMDNYTTGYIVIDAVDVSTNINACEVRKYDNYYTGNDKYYVSNDGGSTWEMYDVGNETIHYFSSSGTKLSLKVVLNRGSATDPSPAYKALGVLYK